MNVVFVTKCYLLWFILLLPRETFKPVQFANAASRDRVLKCWALKHRISFDDCRWGDDKSSVITNNTGFQKRSLLPSVLESMKL